MIITLDHHPIGLTDDILSHSTIPADVGGTPVEAESELGTVVDPVLFKNQVCLTLHLRLHSTAVVLDHARALSADVVQHLFRRVTRTVSDTGAVVTQCVPNELVASTLGHYSTCSWS